VYGGVTLVTALIALFFRTVDLSVCSWIPFGTHFLWHSFLSGAGFIGVLGMLKMQTRAGVRATNVVEAA
jgi:hypothetical protein